MEIVFDMLGTVLSWDMLPYMAASIGILGMVALIKRAIY